jgi:hypothetical protein
VEGSYASWGENIDSLLPKTDLVVMGADDSQGDKWLALVRWQDIQQIAPGCLAADPACDPVRYRTVRWPDPGAIAQLRARAETL